VETLDLLYDAFSCRRAVKLAQRAVASSKMVATKRETLSPSARLQPLLYEAVTA
jgi:hypothetical protein